MTKSIRSRAAGLALALGTTVGTQACDLQRIAADQTVKIAEHGAGGFNGFWDYEVFGQAVPSAILQSEALVRVTPNNEKLLTGLARTYVVYAYGWLADRWELADERGDFAAADELERRIMHMYRRASALSLRVAHMHDQSGGLEETLKTGKLEPLRAYLRQHFTDQDDVSCLYWAGLSWGSMMAYSGGDLKVLADAPLARAFVERSVELDPTFNDAGGLGVLGTVEASFPELFGGDLAEAKGYYDRAIEISKRKNHLLLLSYAKTYAVAKQDRALFVQLLNEILSAPDQGDDLRMNNKVARHRAERYLQRTDDWFPPALDAPPAQAEAP